MPESMNDSFESHAGIMHDIFGMEPMMKGFSFAS